MNRRSFLQIAASAAFSSPFLLPGLSLAQEATPFPVSECIPNETDGTCLPIAPQGARVDLGTPVFSNPTSITNPLFPISTLTQVLLLGTEAGEALRVEATRMPQTKLIDWNGQQVETVVSQFIAYLDGRVAELAMDFFAQDDAGNVWYFGEDVFNYEDGAVANTHGTWLAGRDGVPGMIMPANPQVGNVYRPENVPGFVFEEVTILATNQTIDGPRGQIEGAIVVQELLMDGTHEEKVFAPGYGEFSAKTEDEYLGLALAVPIDFISESAPRSLSTLATTTNALLEASSDEAWDSVDALLTEMTYAWEGLSADDLPPVLVVQFEAAFDDLESAVEDRVAGDLRQAAIDLNRAILDLHLQYRSVTEVDLERIAGFASQLLIDTDPDEFLADVTAIELIWARSGHNVEPERAAQIEESINALRAAIDGEATETAPELASALRALLIEG